MTRLGDVCAIRYGKDHKKLSDGSIPAYGSGGIMRYVDTAICEKPSVLIPRKGTLGNLFYTDEPFWTVDTLFWTDIDQTKIVPKYLYYQLKQKDLASYNVGTAVPSLTVEILNEIDFEVPSIDKQKHIVEVLNSFDSKIALNNQLNDYLSQICDAEFTDFVSNQRDASWHDGTLNELVEIRYGKDHKKLAEGPYPVYGSGGFIRSVEKPLSSGESVLIPRKGSLNNVMYVDEKFWTVDTMFFTIPLKPGAAKYVYQYTKRLDFGTMNSGSAVPSMTTKILNSLVIPIPSDSALVSFNKKLQPFFDLFGKNEEENRRLVSLRDILLPKLMSGEIDVSKVDLTQLTNNHL